MRSHLHAPHGHGPSSSAHTYQSGHAALTLDQKLAPHTKPHADTLNQLMRQDGACVVLTGPSGVGKSTLLAHTLHAPEIAGAIQLSHRLWRPTAIKGTAGLFAFLCDHDSQANSDWHAQVKQWCADGHSRVWVIKGAHHLDDQQLLAWVKLMQCAKEHGAPLRVVLMGKASLGRRFEILGQKNMLKFMPTLLAIQPMTLQQSQVFLREHMIRQGMDISVFGVDQLMHMHQQAGGLPRALCRMVAAYSKARDQHLAANPPVPMVEQGLAWCKRHPSSWIGVGVLSTVMVVSMCFHMRPLMMVSVKEQAQHLVARMRARTTLNVAALSNIPSVADMQVLPYGMEEQIRRA